jgi:hypothetical protein
LDAAATTSEMVMKYVLRTKINSSFLRQPQVP